VQTGMPQGMQQVFNLFDKIIRADIPVNGAGQASL